MLQEETDRRTGQFWDRQDMKTRLCCMNKTDRRRRDSFSIRWNVSIFLRPNRTVNPDRSSIQLQLTLSLTGLASPGETGMTRDPHPPRLTWEGQAGLTCHMPPCLHCLLALHTHMMFGRQAAAGSSHGQDLFHARILRLQAAAGRANNAS